MHGSSDEDEKEGRDKEPVPFGDVSTTGSAVVFRRNVSQLLWTSRFSTRLLENNAGYA